MYCRKCGIQIGDADFCTKCGTKVIRDISEIDLSMYSENQHFAGKKMANPLKIDIKKICVGAGIVAVAFVVVWFAYLKDAFSAKTIDLNQYVSVNAYGYDGYGKATIDLDTEGLCNDFIAKYKLKGTDDETQNSIRGISDGLGLTDWACAEYFLTMIGKVDLSQRTIIRKE